MARQKKTIEVVSLQTVKCDGKTHPPGNAPWECPEEQYSRLAELGAVKPYTPEPDLNGEEEDNPHKE